VICGWLLLQPVTGTIADIAASIFGLFYLGFLPSYWIRLRELEGTGLALTLLACFLIVATDIGSYVIGRRLGRRPLSPISPEQLRGGVKSLTELDLDRDFLSWMQGEFSVSVIPNTGNNDSAQDFRAGLLFLVQAKDSSNGKSLRRKAEASLKKLDEVMKNQYQFQIQPSRVAGQQVVNWMTPFNTLTASRGWLDDDIAFLVVGAPITDKILPKPDQTLASTLPFQQTVPTEPNPSNGQFFLDMETAVKNFTLSSLFPNQQTFLDATRSIGVTSAVSDNRSTRYNIFIVLKKSNSSAVAPFPPFGAESVMQKLN
jgi:hypothetical protein